MPRFKDHRIHAHHAREFDRGEPVQIIFDGEKLPAFNKEPVAVALYANGVRTAARSVKYHRPRGLFCLAGRCMSCLARVDGVPNVRTCHVACRDGMTVKRENAVPQVDDDLLHAFDFFFPRHLNYHEMLTRPRLLNGLLQKSVLRFAGGGDLPDRPGEISPIREKTVEVLVIGGGPAGLAAARAAATAGIRVLLVEDAPELGGHFTGWPEPVAGELDGPGWVAAERAAVEQAGVEVLLNAECIGHFREDFWGVHHRGALLLVKAARVIVATGAYDQPPLFANNDLPNIFSARGLLKLTNRWGVCPAVACTIIGVDDAALSLAERLPEIGVRVTGLVTESARLESDPDKAERIQRAGIPIFLGHRVTQAIGTFHLKGLRLEPTGGGDQVDLRSDLVAVSSTLAPSWELATQAGAQAVYEAVSHGFVVQADEAGRTARPELFVTGEMRGEAPPAAIIARGRLTGETVARDLRPTAAPKEN